jgi:hypothetical protein
MEKLHITQDDYGFWMLSLEKADGELQLLAHQFAAPQHLIENAHELVEDGTHPNAVVLVDPPRKENDFAATAAPAKVAPMEYRRPQPRKAGL